MDIITQRFISDLRSLESDVIKTGSLNKCVKKVTTDIVLKIIEQDSELKERVDSLQGRMAQVRYLPIEDGLGLDKIVCNIIGITNQSTQEDRDRFISGLKDHSVIEEYLKINDKLTTTTCYLFKVAMECNNAMLAADIFKKNPQQNIFLLFDFFSNTRITKQQLEIAQSVIQQLKIENDNKSTSIIIQKLLSPDYSFCNTPLARALEYDEWDIAEWILAQLKTLQGNKDLAIQQLTTPDKNGRTLMVEAILKGNLDMAKWILKQLERLQDNIHPTIAIQQLTIPDTNDMTPMAQVALKGDLEMAKWILSQLKSPTIAIQQLTTPDINNRTPMTQAVLKGNLEMAKWILSQLKSPTIAIQQLTTPDMNGRTPMIQAVLESNLNMAKWIFEQLKTLQNNTDPTIAIQQLTTPDINGSTPMALAVVMNNLDIAKWIFEELKTLQNNTDPTIAIQQLTIPDTNGTTPMAKAMNWENLEMAEWIFEQLEKLKDYKDLAIQQLTTSNTNGKTPMAKAVSGGNLEMVKWLFEQLEKLQGNKNLAIQQLTTPDTNGRTPLTQAVLLGYLNMAKWICENLKASSRNPGIFAGGIGLHQAIDNPETLRQLSAEFSQADLCKTLPVDLVKTLKAENPSPSLLGCSLALLEEPSESIRAKITSWDDLRNATLQLPDSQMRIRGTCALKQLMQHSEQLTDELKQVLTDPKNDIAYRLMYLELTLSNNTTKYAALLLDILKKKNVNLKYDTIQRCKRILFLLDALKEIHNKIPGKDQQLMNQIDQIVRFLFESTNNFNIFNEINYLIAVLNISSRLDERTEILNDFSTKINNLDDKSKKNEEEIEKINCKIKELKKEIEKNRKEYLNKKINEFKKDNTQKPNLKVIFNKEFSQQENAIEKRHEIQLKRQEINAINSQKLSYKNWLKEIIQSKSGIEISPEVFENAANAFEERFPNAHLTYLSTLLSMPEVSPEKRQENIKNFYKAWEMNFGSQPHWTDRYDPKENPHIKAVEKIRPGFYKNWQKLPKTIQPLLDNIHTKSLQQPTVGQGKSPRAILIQAINDNHLDTNYVFLKRLQKGENEKNLLATLETELNRTPENNRALLLAQRELILLTQTPWTDRNGVIQKIDQIKNWLNLKTNALFSEDLNTLMTMASCPQTAQGITLHLRLRDDFESILLGGTEIQGSCQNIRNPSNFSHGTIGYLLNGHLMLGHCDKSGRWVTRTLLRPLLLEENGQKSVVLLLERIYPATTSEMRPALLRAAEVVAEELGVGLVSVEEGMGKAVSGSLFLAGGRAPEYIDASEGMDELQKPCQIRECHWLRRIDQPSPTP